MSAPEAVRAAILADARRRGVEVAEIVEDVFLPTDEPPRDVGSRPMWFGIDADGEPVTRGYVE